jgi:transcriptional regulator with XRE-family HTH domain
MLEIPEITERTGDISLPDNRILTGSTGGMTGSGKYQPLSKDMQKTRISSIRKQVQCIQISLPYDLLAGTTGADLAECRELLLIVGTEVVSHQSMTYTYFMLGEATQQPKEPSRPLPLYSSLEGNLSHRTQGITELAKRLRQSSGLDVESLARICNVSRVTYHRWLRGLPLHKRHRDYLLELLPLIEEAVHRLGSPEAVSTWLLTPTSSGGKKPIDYLVEKDYELFRGFLLRHRTGKEVFHPLQPSERIFKPRPPEETEEIREQLRPHTWYDEDNDPQSDG